MDLKGTCWMLKIAICDDEKYYRDGIYKFLTEYVTARNLQCIIDRFKSGKAFLAQCDNAVKYDIVFMDINMEEMDGIETAKQIRSFHAHTYIVLVTAFIDYVLEGYKVDAVRYIMKDNLEASVPECMDTILEKMQLQQCTFTFLQGEKTLYTDNLIYMESRKHKVIFFYMESSIVTYELYDTLNHVAEQLSEYGFLRIHKSYLVNMKHIKKISNYEAVLDIGENLPVPRLRFQRAKEAFAAYKGAM